MRQLFATIAKLPGCARGATAIEYGLIVALIAIAVVGAIRGVGGGSSSLWDGLTNEVTNAM